MLGEGVFEVVDEPNVHGVHVCTLCENQGHPIADPHRICTYVPGSRVWNRPEQGRHIRWEFRLLAGEERDTMASPETVQVVRKFLIVFFFCFVQKW